MVWYTAQYTDANGAGAGAGDGDGDDIGRRCELLSLGQRSGSPPAIHPPRCCKRKQLLPLQTCNHIIKATRVSTVHYRTGQQIMDTLKQSPLELRAALARDGFVRIPSILSSTQIENLRAACKRSVDLAREGKWPFVRTLPKQFPPWTDDVSQGIWGVQHLLHPELPDHDLFASTYFSPLVCAAVTSLVQCQPDELVMELYNLLVRPDRDFELRWHRDDIAPSVSPEEEEARLRDPILHAQWNLALYDDESLIVVPGSHVRARTPTERSADPFEASLPGQMTVGMQAGDVVFYNNNILHRGVYKSAVERMTLHGSMGVLVADRARARNVLQHGVGSWVNACDFSHLKSLTGDDDLGPLAEGMKQKLVSMGSGHSIEYSQLE